MPAKPTNSRPEIVFTLPACMGGVASFNYNIINHSRLIRQFYSKVILLQEAADIRAPFQDRFMVDETTVFHYSNKENQYYVQKRLAALLGNGEGCIVTDNLLTLGAAARFKNPKTVFHLLHDYFYVNQNISAGDLVDVAIAHSSFFSDAVFASNPSLFFNRSFYIPYGVGQVPRLPEKNNPRLKLVFLGRLEEGKGVLLLKKINDLLVEKNIAVDWAIIGKGSLKKQLQHQWAAVPNLQFYEPDSTEAVYQLLAGQDLFIFPTHFEGTPVSILECIANGVVPIVNDLPGGIRDIVQEGIGHRCEQDNIEQYVGFIIQYHEDRAALKKIQEACFDFSNRHYNIEKNADHYFKKFLDFSQLKRAEKHSSLPLSRLDKALFPNPLVKFIRNIKA